MFFEICDHHSVNNLYNHLIRLSKEGKNISVSDWTSLGIDSVDFEKDDLSSSALYLEDKVPDSGDSAHSDSIKKSQLVYDDNSSADTLYEVAESMYAQGSYGEAIKVLEKALKKYDKEKCVSGQAKTHHLLGKLYKLVYEIPRAYIETQKAIEIYTLIGNKAERADCYIIMSDICIMMADYDAAQIKIQEAKEWYSESFCRLGCANALFFECKNLFYSGKCRGEQEKETFFKTLDRVERFYHLENCILGIANVWDLRAEYYSRNDDYKNAILSLRKAEEQYNLLGDHFQQKKIIISIIENLMLHCDYEEALEELEHAEKYCDEVNDIRFSASVNYHKGEFWYIYCSRPDTEEYEKALSAINEAVRLFREINDEMWVANSLKVRGDIYKISKDLSKAEADYTEAEKIYIQNKSELGLANVVFSRAKMHKTYRNVEIPIIEEEHRSAIELYKKVGCAFEMRNALDSLASFFCEQERWNDASVAYEELLSLIKYDENNKDTYNKLIGKLKECKRESGDIIASNRIYDEILEIMEEN